MIMRRLVYAVCVAAGLLAPAVVIAQAPPSVPSPARHRTPDLLQSQAPTAPERGQFRALWRLHRHRRMGAGLGRRRAQTVDRRDIRLGDHQPHGPDRHDPAADHRRGVRLHQCPDGDHADRRCPSTASTFAVSGKPRRRGARPQSDRHGHRCDAPRGVGQDQRRYRPRYLHAARQYDGPTAAAGRVQRRISQLRRYRLKSAVHCGGARIRNGCRSRHVDRQRYSGIWKHDRAASCR